MFCLLVDADDEIKLQRRNSWNLNFINNRIIIPETYKTWIYKQYAAKFNTYNFVNVTLFP